MASQVPLKYPDITDWQRWSSSRRPVERGIREVKGRLRPVPTDPATLWLPHDDPATLVLADMLTPSCRAAVVAPLTYLDPLRTAVIAPHGIVLNELRTTHHPVTYTGVHLLPRVRSVLTLGAYLTLAQDLFAWASSHDIPFVVAQHGLLTPWAPPAPPGAHVAAWSTADADLWADNRSDITTHVVGSQMFWNAAALPPVSTMSDRVLVLGQLHGAELSRRDTFNVYWRFCREQASDYRPHPNERDFVSRGIHEVMKRGGVSFSTDAGSLVELARPVVSIFSTGTLEAASRGLPAWVHHPAPPTWVREFWDRYHLSPWGQAPTPAWGQPAVEPARAIADLLENL